MRTDEIKANFSKNIKFLRENKKMTQLEFGTKIGYSDKSISKWENGDVLPDVAVIDHIAQFFNLTVNDLITDKTPTNIKTKNRNSLIVASSLFLVLTIASILFFFLKTFTEIQNLWMIYIFSLPVFCTVFIILSALFYNYKYIILACSMLLWSIALSLYLTFLSLNIWTLFIICICFQTFLIFMLFIIKIYKTKKIQ